jgi:hypothetical protein
VPVLGQNGRSSAATSRTPPAVDIRERRSTDRIQTQPIVAHVNEQEVTVVNLSNAGAQMISTTRFKPNQRVRVFLPNESGFIRCHAVIAWAMFEIQRRGDAIYRLGLHFIDGDAESLEVYCQRHKLK